MTLEADSQKLAKHLIAVLDDAKNVILTGDGVPAFNAVSFGEPQVITVWPHVAIEPNDKVRSIKATQMWAIEFEFHVMLYHGEITNPSSRQEESFKRAEALESFFHSDYHWNFIDSADSTKNKVIFGYVMQIDHPTVLAPAGQMWSASRLILRAESQETFTNAGT